MKIKINFFSDMAIQKWVAMLLTITVLTIGGLNVSFAQVKKKGKTSAINSPTLTAAACEYYNISNNYDTGGFSGDYSIHLRWTGCDLTINTADVQHGGQPFLICARSGTSIDGLYPIPSGITGYYPASSIPGVSVNYGGICGPPVCTDPENWQNTGQTRCNGNASEYEQNDVSCNNRGSRWIVSDPNGCNPCNGVVANWQNTGSTRCNGNASEYEQTDTNSGCTGNSNRWIVSDPNGCNPCNGVVANWQNTGSTRCNGNASEYEQTDTNSGCTGNTNRWLVSDPNGCNPCNGVVANWQNTGSTRCNGNASEYEQTDTNSGCTGNTNRWIVSDPNGCNPCAGVVANWQNTGSTRCNGNASEYEQTDTNSGCTGNSNRWIVSDPNGCNPCNGVVANWQNTGSTRCNGNASEYEQTDTNSGCTGNTNRWLVSDPNGCNPCNGVVANWQDTGNIRCVGNAREKEQTDGNASCTNNVNRWIVVDPMGCFVDPCAGVVANWQDTGNTRCVGNAREKEQTDGNASCTNNVNRWIVVDPMGCFVDPCAGVVANWQDTGNTRCVGNAREKEQADANAICTNNANRWVVVDPMGCYVDPCAGVVANWQGTGETRCNGPATERRNIDLNASCTGNPDQWIVIDLHGCDPCFGVVAEWQDTGNTRCVGDAKEKEIRDVNANCTNNANRWVVVDPHGCNPCYGVVANWQGTGDTRCNGPATERRNIDLNASCTGNPDQWIVIDPHGCDPCFGIVANWEGTGETRCNGPALERRSIDLNASCTGNVDRWTVIDPYGCDKCHGVVANWQGTGDTRCNGPATERRSIDLNAECTKNEDMWTVIDPHGCDPCYGIVANWEGTGETRCNNNNLERKSIDLSGNCTGNTERWDIIELNGCLVETPTGTVKWYNPDGKIPQDSTFMNLEMDVCFGDTVKVQAFNSAGDQIEWVIDSTLNFVGASYVNMLTDVNKRNYRIYNYRAFRTNASGIVVYSDWGQQLIVRVNSNPEKPIIEDAKVCEGKIAELIGKSDGTSLMFDFGTTKIISQSSSIGSITATIQPSATGKYKLTSTNEFGCKSETEFNVLVLENPTSPEILSEKMVLKYGESTSLSVANCTGVVHWDNGQTGTPLVINPIIETTYKSKCVNENGCESTLSEITIGVLPQAPEVDGEIEMLDKTIVDGKDFTICDGDYLKVRTLTDYKGQIAWYQNGVKVDAKEGLLYPRTNSTIIAKAVNKYGESEESNPIKVAIRSSELVDDLLVLYPNPTVDAVKIKSENCIKGVKIRLYTMLGQEIYDNWGTYYKGNELVFDISRLATAQYIIQIYNERNQKVGRRVIKGGSAKN